MILPSKYARNIGVMLYSVLSFECHITVICKSCYFNIRSIYRIRTFLSAEYRKIFVNAFVTSRRENCNSLLFGLPCGLLRSSLNFLYVPLSYGTAFQTILGVAPISIYHTSE